MPSNANRELAVSHPARPAAAQAAHQAAHPAAPDTPKGALEQAALLAADILDEARGALMMSLRFMDVALWSMPFVPRYLGTGQGSDGRLFLYNPVRVVRQYQVLPNETVRDYLHVILHCVFRHPFQAQREHPDLWDTACDVAVEAIALELVGTRYPSDLDEQRLRALEKLRSSCAQLTARKLYRLLVKALADPEPARKAGITADFIASLAGLFARDDHGPWPRTEKRVSATLKTAAQPLAPIEDESGMKLKGPELEEDAEDDEPEGEPAPNLDGSPSPSSGNPPAMGDVENGDRFVKLNDADEFSGMLTGDLNDLRDRSYEDVNWKDISKLIETDLEMFLGKPGVDTGTFLVNLQVANRKTYDYRDFLRRFMSLSEELKVSTDEFDYIFYTYGLRLFKNMPLVEPLEYQESNRVRDFVIAIDTSASCAGGLVQRFIEKTYDVLKTTEGFGRKVNIHIIQCDCSIRREVKITSIRDLDDLFLDFSTRGYGGTDFRPVFKRVNELIDNREFTNLKGLIYLTDGLGKFPDAPPPYETVFVFVDETQKERQVPPWAMKVVMDEDEILEL